MNAEQVMQGVHPTAIVDPGATLGEGVSIGPYCTVGPKVSLGDGTVLHGHVVVAGRTGIGPRCEIFPFASLGHPPQDLKYAGEDSALVSGADNKIREQVTMNPGTTGGGMETRVGDGCLFMVGAHVAHDCKIGNGVIMANNATLGGHVVVEDNAIIGGLAAVRQFVRIGRNAMVGGMSGVEQDVIPFGLVMGDRAKLNGLNMVGLRRHGFEREDIQALQKLYKQLFAGGGTMAERLDKARSSFEAGGPVGDLIAFAAVQSNVGLCQPKPENGG